jgi:hypothetical protein
MSNSLTPLSISDEGQVLHLEASPTNAISSAVGAPLSGRVSPLQLSESDFSFLHFAPSQQVSLSLTRQPTDLFGFSSSPALSLGGSFSPRASPRLSLALSPTVSAASRAAVSQFAFPSFGRALSGSYSASGCAGAGFQAGSLLSFSKPVSVSASAPDWERDFDMAISPKGALSPIGRIKKDPEECISNAKKEIAQKGADALTAIVGAFLDSDDESDADSEGSEGCSDYEELGDYFKTKREGSASALHSAALFDSIGSHSQSESGMALAPQQYDHGRRGTKRKLPQNLSPGGAVILDEDVDPSARVASAKTVKREGQSASAEHEWNYHAIRYDRQLQGIPQDLLEQIAILEFNKYKTE